MPEKYQFLWVRLQMEQHKLLDWGEIVNLSEDDTSLHSGLRFSRHLINDVLHQIEALLLDINGLSARYKLKLLVDEGNAPATPPPPYSRSQQASGRAMKAKALSLIAQSRRYPTRLRWAAFDCKKFESLLTDLAVLNDSMIYFLETEQKSAAYKLQQNTFMEILQVSNKVNQLVDLVTSLEVSGRVSNTDMGLPASGLSRAPSGVQGGSTTEARISHEKRLLQLARFKALSVAVEQSSDDPVALSLRKSVTENLKLNAEELVEIRATTASVQHLRAGSRTSYTYRGSGVWVEWKTYVAQGLDSMPPGYVEDRVRKLAALLHNEQKPVEFRVPDCLGYMHQPELERFGYVFCWPKAESSQKENHSPPISLHALLRSLEYPPPLGIRIAIMRAIATSIWFLHATNWLHKGLRSENVIFQFLGDVSSTPITAPNQALLGEPFISGFEYSRPAEAGERTERPAVNSLYHELYRHPHAQFDLPREVGVGRTATGINRRLGFRHIYDVYALGVVLLEVALWEPVHKLVGVKDEVAVMPKEARGAYTALAENRKYEGKLRAAVGDSVAEMVVACITGELVEKEAVENRSTEKYNLMLQAALGEKIVKRLDEIVI
ncbi:hypothetical protein H072_7645 [Dactylellina haptotyla CBS 200.50]|uniref:Prion-inhibition and propagation HeLo domain-containing protein n=1 Tax=Dactylellina haptotyla (strain CBS 200.50) TaxID=1284197 RepID=S8A6I3_DACHA|nr:hypothetical protein H072_7645 [Dactylellina haptotyla CBS 200.50]